MHRFAATSETGMMSRRCAGRQVNGLFEKYFSFQGRLARLPYFIRGIQLGVAATLVFLLSIPAFSNGNGVLWWLGLVLVVVASAIYLGGFASLIVRRLHDLGLPGYHAIWVAIALVISNIASYSQSYSVVLLNLPFIAVGLWILFWPGQRGPNRFGE
jgi:uncharacterized membrane protein YhaH (DUF805 family)